MKKICIYQVLPRFWGKGKFSDWKSESFEYVKSLGIDHIWFTGVIRHASGQSFVKGDPGCPYSISDYYDVNPYLAENEDERMREFDGLLKRTHKAGLKVLVDFVPNHIACNYADEHGGIPHFDYCDYDWTDTLKIDYSNPRTREAMLSILRFWARRGVDGFRCDMVELVPVEFFGWAVSELKKEYPELTFVAEVYEKVNYSRYLNDGHFDLLYDKSGIYDTLRGIVCNGESAEGITRNWQWLGEMQPRMLNFLENHDEQRLASRFFAGSAEKGYAALAAAALFNDASFMLYAGQETGEDATGTDNGRTSIFNRTKVEVMEKRRGNKVLKRYREILSLLSNPAFRDGGNWDLCYCNTSENGFDVRRHFAFLRFKGDEKWLTVCNFSGDRCKMDIIIPEEAARAGGLHPCRVPVEISPFDAVTLRL